MMLKNLEHIYLADQTQEIGCRECLDGYRNVYFSSLSSLFETLIEKGPIEKWKNCFLEIEGSMRNYKARAER